MPDFDVLVGGFPCQAFSIAGKRRGFRDTRGTLFFEIARVLKEKQPRILVLENVKGLLSHDKGNSIAVIASTLDELGYDLQWNVCNSKNYGVPQNRQRIFIVGHLRASGQSAKQVLSFRRGDSETIRIQKIGNINPSGNGANDNVFDVRGLSTTLTTNKGEGIKVFQINKSNLKSNNGTQPYYQDRVYDPFGLSPALNSTIEPKIALKQLVGGSQGNRVYCPSGVACTQASGAGGLGAIPVLTPDRVKKRQNGRRLKTNGGPSFTLTAQDKHGVFDGTRIRRLTPKECERLQGFADEWTKYGVSGELIGDTQRYKVCGNSATVTVVAEIFSQLFKLNALS